MIRALKNQKNHRFCDYLLYLLNFFVFCHNFTKKYVDFISKAYIIGVAKKKAN